MELSTGTCLCCSGSSAGSSGSGRRSGNIAGASLPARGVAAAATAVSPAALGTQQRGRQRRPQRRSGAPVTLPLGLLLLLLLLAGGGCSGGAAADDNTTTTTAPATPATPPATPATTATAAAAAASGRPLRFVVVNQVSFHLEVVAGAMHVLKQLTSAPVVVYLPSKVLKTGWYGFMTWLGSQEGFDFRVCDEKSPESVEAAAADGDGVDLAWFISPEYHAPWSAAVAARLKPKVGLYMVHNGHITDAVFNAVKALSPAGVPLITLAPHVAANISARATAADDGGAATRPPPQWLLPVFPYSPPAACSLQDITSGHSCLKGFSVQGRIERSRRNYTAMWEQIALYRAKEGGDALKNFRLNILGESVEAFAVPAPVRDLVAVYKNPPYPIFYDVVYHSYALVPMLASPLYYVSKFSSTVYTSFITGVPIIADDAFLKAYSMIERQAVYHQEPGKNELDVMFAVGRMDPDGMWRTRVALEALRSKMNARVRGLLLAWLRDKGLAPDADSEVAQGTATRRRRRNLQEEGGGKGRRAQHRRMLLSPAWLLHHLWWHQQPAAA